MIKTGVAVALSMWLVQLTGRPFEVFAGVAAVLSVQRSVAESRRTLVSQAAASVLGALVGGVAGYLLGANPLAIGLVVILMIALGTRLRWQDAMGTAVFVAIVVMDHREGDYVSFALWRFASVMTGTLCGLAVNAWLLPPRHGQRLAAQLLEAGAEVDRLLVRVGASLRAPESLGKVDIKEAAAGASAAIERAKAALALWREEESDAERAPGDDGGFGLYEKAVNTLYSMVERGLDLHRSALVATRAGKSPAYSEAMRIALESLSEWRQALYRRIAAAAQGRLAEPVDPALQTGVAGQMARLQRMTIGELAVTTAAAGMSIEELHARIEAHNMADEASHMAQRLEALARLLDGQDQARGGPLTRPPVAT